MASREEAGQPVVISGVTFDGSDAPDFELGCVAHSDGDVLLHSIADLCNVTSKETDSTRSIFNTSFKERKRVIKNNLDYDTYFKN